MATTLYCAISDVQNRLSADGVTYRTDDAPPTANGDVLDEASREIDWYCLTQYAETDLATSRWVKHQCAVIASYLLCERRGNPVPSGIARKYDRLVKKLEAVQSGARVIPDLGRRRTDVPTVSNVRPRLDPFPRTVVERNRSSSRDRPTDYTQNADRFDYLDYSI